MSSMLLIHSCPHSYISEAYAAPTQCFQHFGSQGLEILDTVGWNWTPCGLARRQYQCFGLQAASVFRVGL